jgi:membrane-associated phospholipid phosphatase
LIAPLIMFGCLTAMVWHRHGPVTLDSWLLGRYVPAHSSSLFRATQVVTEVGSPAVVVVFGLVAAVSIWHRFRSMVWSIAVLGAPALAGLAESSLKVVVGRTRPLSSSFTGESGNGFPSGHASGFAALAVVCALAFCALTDRSPDFIVFLSLIASVMVAITRVIVGAHYPTDAIAGLVLGLAIADSVAYVARSAHRKTIDGATADRGSLKGATAAA